jgi:hypothetical protein
MRLNMGQVPLHLGSRSAEGLAVGLRPLVDRKMLQRLHECHRRRLLGERSSLRASCWLSKYSLYARLARRLEEPAAVNRVCDMASATPASVPAEPSLLRQMLSRIRPAAHGVSAKSYSNLRSRSIR